MAGIWVVFGHSAVISKNDKWSAGIAEETFVKLCVKFSIKQRSEYVMQPH